MDKAKLKKDRRKSQKNQKDDEMEEKLYTSSQEFLTQITLNINTAKTLYQYYDSHLYNTNTVEDEYVVVVLEIMDQTLKNFYGGNYLIQQWTKKRKLFQTVHYAKPHKFFLYKQRFMYSMQGTSDECQYLYIVNFYQEIYNKIQHPLFDPRSQDGIHELQIYVEAKMMLVCSQDRIMWAPFKFSEGQGPEGMKGSSIMNSMHQSFTDGRAPTPRNIESIAKKVQERAGIQSLASAVVLETQFKSVFANLDGDAPEFLQIFDLGSEGYLQKEINVIMEQDTKIAIYKIIPRKIRKFQMFKFVEKYRFDKIGVGLAFREPVLTVRIVNYSDSESLYIMTKGEGEMQLLLEKDSEQHQVVNTRSTIKRGMTMASRMQQVAPDEQHMDESEFLSLQDAVIKLKSHFVRRQHIYLEEQNGTIKRLLPSDCKLQTPLKRASRLGLDYVQAQLLEIAMHIGFYSDYLKANTALLISHGKILSIYDFKTMKWAHILPDQQGKLNEESQFSQSKSQVYFGMPEDEISSLFLNHIFKNSIYDCLVQYKNTSLKRLKYFNECQKTCFEKAVIFKGMKVRQIVKNYDIKVYRLYGDIIERTYFMVQLPNLKTSEIWISENGSKMTRFIRKIDKKIIILNLQNSQSDTLALYDVQKRTLSFYSILFFQQCLDLAELEKYKKIQVDFTIKDTEQQQSYFYFDNKLFYIEDGNLWCYNFSHIGKKAKPMKEYNFKSTIREFYMADASTVFYKDKKNSFRFANLTIQKKFDIAKQPTKIMVCSGAPLTKLDYCYTTNRFSLFSSPFDISIVPNLTNYSIDLMSTINFENNFVFWKQHQNRLFAFKQPNVVITWNLDTGKVLKSQEQDLIYLKNFAKVSEWNGTTLLKLVRDQQSHDIESDYPSNNRQFDEEIKARNLFPKKHLFSVVDIYDTGEIFEVCRFLFEHRIGQSIYVSYPYLLLMEEGSTKLYSLEGRENKFRTMKLMNTFFEPQMKVGRPLYFSPDFHHRLFVDTETKEIVLNYTLNNEDLLRLSITKELMWQAKKTHPLIYFHDNDKIVYLTVNGIEKVFKIEKTQKKRKTITTLKEISNCYYSHQDMVRRILYDAYNFKKELGCQIQQQHMLQIRSNIMKRGLLLNCYLIDDAEKKAKHRQILREYPDKNVGNFSYFIVDNYRRELNFSYQTWKIIEQIGNKKLSISSLKKTFVSQLVFTILPSQETVLHYLNDNFEELENFLKVITEDKHTSLIMQKKSEHVTLDINDIPFLPNLNGKTPLHNSVDKNQTRFTDKVVTILADTDFDHHSRFITDKLHKLIDQVPKAFGYYLEQRQRTTDWVKQYTRGKLAPLNECEFMMASNNMWDEQLKDTLPESVFNPAVLEVPMTMSVLDLPNIQKYKNKLSSKFMDVMSSTDNIELFASASMRAMVEIKWPLVKQAMTKKLFYPYLMFLLLFIVYADFIFEYFQENNLAATEFKWEVGNPDFWIRNSKEIVRIVLLCLAGYFLLISFRSFVVQGPTRYFTNPWRYIDMIPLATIIFALLFEYFTSDYPQFERAINGLSAFLMWLKFLYFLRMYRQSSKFISMIVAVISDMKIFLLVFFVSLVTFSQSMYIISNNNDPDERFITSIWDSLLFTYNISLGSWDVNGFGEANRFILLTLFLISTLFLCIIMLNLLIAVISDTYARVNESSQNELYRNFADLIVENEFLIPASQIEEHDEKGSYLYIAKEDQSEARGDQMEIQVSEIKKTILKRTAVLDRVSRDLMNALTAQINLSVERFNSMQNEDHEKTEANFKSILKKLEKNQILAGFDPGSPLEPMNTSPDRSTAGVGSIQPKTPRAGGRRSARPPSQQQKQQQQVSPSFDESQV